MYFLTPVCCLCLNRSNQKLYNLFNTDADNMSYYEKLSTTLTHLVFNKNHEDYMLCTKCCINVNSVYEFNNRSLESLNKFLGYKEKLNSSTCESSEITVRVVDIGEDNKCIEQDRSTDQGIEVIVDSCDSENEIMHSIDVKLEKFEEFYNNIQHLVHLRSESNAALNIELVQDVKLQLHVEDDEQPMDVASLEDDILENNLGVNEIKIEEPDMKIECFGDDVCAFDQLLDIHSILDDTSVHSQLAEKNSSEHTGHGSVEIQKQTDDTNTTKYKLSHSCQPQHSDVINRKPMNDGSAISVSAPVNHCRARSETCSSGDDVLRIHSTSEEEGSKQSSTLIAHSLPRPSYVSDVCNMDIKNSRNLVSHNVVHTKKKPHVCDICKKRFSSSSALTTHKHIHTGQKPYICDVCKKGFSSSSNLIAHKHTHYAQKSFVCDICKKKFSLACNLATHKRIHTGQKPHVCDVCQKKFSQAHHLATHKLIHTGQKPYSCDICKMTFTQAGNLATHKRIHTGQKPFVCVICEKRFTQAVSLARHKLIHTDQKPYVCGVCKKEFRHSFTLSKHKLVHASTSEAPC